MSIFVDTSALVAFLDADQPRHAEVIDTWDRAIADEKALFTSSCVLVESFALVQRRLGLEALRALADVLAPMLRVLRIDEELHAAAVASLFTAGRRKLSLVDARASSSCAAAGWRRHSRWMTTSPAKGSGGCRSRDVPRSTPDLGDAGRVTSP